MIRRCKGCGRIRMGVKSRRQNTAYITEKDNYITCCKQCFDMAEDYWAEMWADYNSGRL